MRVSGGSARRLTELEGAVLGVIAQSSPCTPYRVRRVFLDSPSPYWSGSAGAIYPLLRRLEKRGLLTSRRRPTGRRAALAYALTASGTRAFREWLQPPWSAVVTGVPADPLRTRVSFLGLLPRRARARFFRSAIEGMDPSLREHESPQGPVGRAADRFEKAVARGALAMLRARKRWLDGTARALVEDDAGR
jgi:DNA-binding PadR family transcriptional regulator